MADFTQIAISVGPALVTGAVGYGGAWLQFRSTSTQVEAENRRFAQQQLEQDRRERREAYLDMLDSVHRLHRLCAGISPASGEEVMNDWRETHDGIVTRVFLRSDSKDVEDAAAAFQEFFGTTFADAITRQEADRDKSYPDRLKAAYALTSEELAVHERALLGAFRKDSLLRPSE